MMLMMIMMYDSTIKDNMLRVAGVCSAVSGGVRGAAAAASARVYDSALLLRQRAQACALVLASALALQVLALAV